MTHDNTVQLADASSVSLAPRGGFRVNQAENRGSAKSPAITIITVTYNAGSSIEETLKSIFCQPHPGIEVIVIDGGSTDNTVEILKKYNDKIAYWISEPDKGIYAAMNKGLDQVRKGSLILFLNAGDLFVGDVVVEQIENPCFLPVKTNSLFSKELRKLKKKRFFFRGIPYCHQGIVFPYTNSRYNITYKIASDLDFFIQLKLSDNLPILNTKGYVYYDNSGFSKKNSVNRDAEIFEIIRKRFGLLRSLVFWVYSHSKLWIKPIINLKTLS